MARTLTDNMALKVVQQDDVELIMVVKIEWGSSTTWHADRAFSFGGNTVEDDLYKISEITYRRAAFKSVVVGTVNVSLCDTDKTYFTRLKTLRLVKAVATVYFFANELVADTDFVELFKGEILTPVTYDEVERVLSFDIVPPFSGTKQIPFAPTEDQQSTASNNTAHTNTIKKYFGAGFPTVFGKVVDVRAQRVYEPPFVRLAAGIDESAGITCVVETEEYNAANPFIGSTTYNYWIGDELVDGYFGGSTNKNFVISTRNKRILQITTTNRPSSATDPDALLASVLWLSSAVILVGRWVKMSSGTTGVTPKTGFWAFCYKQISNKCWFTYNWQSSTSTNLQVPANCTLDAHRYPVITNTTWSHPPGTIVKRQTNNLVRYVISDTPISADSDVVRVRAWRNVPIVGGPSDGETTRQLVLVPTTHYTIDRTSSGYAHVLADSTVRYAATITFQPPLEDRHQGWESDEIFVSIRSNFTSGDERNAAEAIKYILQKYTNLTPDSTSFAAVTSQISGFDVDFALYEPRDAFEVCCDIAWQARCALIVFGSTVKIKYLSVSDPGASAAEGPTIDNDLVTLDGISEIGYTEFEEVVTVANTTFTPTPTLPAEFYTKRLNTSVFGEKVRDFKFTVYQRKSLMQKSRDWWLNRWGNVWKQFRFRCLLPAIEFEPMDFVNVSVTDLGDGTQALGSGAAFRGVIEEIKHLDDGTSELLVWTPIIAGGTNPNAAGWNSVSSETSVDPLPSTMAGPTTDELEAVVSKEG